MSHGQVPQGLIPQKDPMALEGELHKERGPSKNLWPKRNGSAGLTVTRGAEMATTQGGEESLWALKTLVCINLQPLLHPPGL
jgi:hypothetical protein